MKPVIGYASAQRETERGTKGRKKSTFCPAEPPVPSALDLFALSRNFQDFVTVYPLLLSVFVENLFNCHLCIFYDDYCTLYDILNLGIKYFKISVFFLPTLFAHNTFRKFKPACKMWNQKPDEALSLWTYQFFVFNHRSLVVCLSKWWWLNPKFAKDQGERKLWCDRGLVIQQTNKWMHFTRLSKSINQSLYFFYSC